MKTIIIHASDRKPDFESFSQASSYLYLIYGFKKYIKERFYKWNGRLCVEELQQNNILQ